MPGQFRWYPNKQSEQYSSGGILQHGVARAGNRVLLRLLIDQAFTPQCLSKFVKGCPDIISFELNALKTGKIRGYFHIVFR